MARRVLAWRWFVWGLGRSWEVAWPAWLIVLALLTWLLWPSGEETLRKPERPQLQATAASALAHRGPAPVADAASALAEAPVSPAPAMVASAPQAAPTVTVPAPAQAPAVRDVMLYGPDPARASGLPESPAPALKLRLDETPSTPKQRSSQAKSTPSSQADPSESNRREQ